MEDCHVCLDSEEKYINGPDFVCDVCNTGLCGRHFLGVVLPDGETFCDYCAPPQECRRCNNKSMIQIPNSHEWWCEICEHDTPQDQVLMVKYPPPSKTSAEKCLHKYKDGKSAIRYNDETMSGVNGWDETCDICGKTWW